MIRRTLTILALLLGSVHASGQPTRDANGEVTLPLEQYQQLIEQVRERPDDAPADHAIGHSTVSVDYTVHEGVYAARVSVETRIELFTDRWTAVRLLGPGAALESAWVGDRQVQLVQRADGFYWVTNQPGAFALAMVYRVDAQSIGDSRITTLPLPPAAATAISVVVPEQDIDLALAPVSGLVVERNNGETVARGNLPAVNTVMISWRDAVDLPYTISRADYRGEVIGEAVRWRVHYEVELFDQARTLLSLLPDSATLVALTVDGKPATVLIDEGRFATPVSGTGRHQVEVVFHSAIQPVDGVPGTGFAIPGVPVSRFELTLAGDKLVRVHPLSNVSTVSDDGTTRAEFFVPLTEQVSLSWMEAIPEDIAVELRANASVYHALYAAEGVLYGDAILAYEITRGETSTLSFSLPADAHVNRVVSAQVGIADWIELEADPDSGRHAYQVFLARPVDGDLHLKVNYESLMRGKAGQAVTAPLIRAHEVNRQRGMLALLSSSDLALTPSELVELSEVGENQLPAFFRNELTQPVLHTFKYHQAEAGLTVAATQPEREQGKFNAQIDTLVSISEVALKGAATIDIAVKTGVLQTLSLTLPDDLNLLGVSGPSIRNHTVELRDGMQWVDIEFTREMDGQFQLDLNYERIMPESDSDMTVPDLAVIGADVEHGRIAVEALAALEIQPLATDHLSTLEVNELPRQLLLKTTNPILLAFKYVKGEQPTRLSLRVTRHQEIDVKVAAIDQADYTTLYTRDGLAVTKAQYQVRNSRRQFLRLNLPRETEIWSVFVNGRAQKPAFADQGEATSHDVLIKMINSATPFPVEVVYATPAAAISMFGAIRGHLPRPDMIVTASDWRVFVPEGPNYGEPETNMDQRNFGAAAADMGKAMREAASNLMGDALKIELPTQGLMYRFSKLYANQTREDAFFELPYTGRNAGQVGVGLSLLGVALIWLSIALLARGRRSIAVAGLILGSGLASVAMIGLGASPLPASILTLVIAAGAGGYWLVRRRQVVGGTQTGSL